MVPQTEESSKTAAPAGASRVPPAVVRFVSAGLLAVLLAVSVLLHLRLRTMAYDDAYIHLRIVRNLLVHGNAWFNPGERVMVTSSPLWTALLWSLHLSRWPLLLPILEAVLLWLAVVLAAALAVSSVGFRSRELPALPLAGESFTPRALASPVFPATPRALGWRVFTAVAAGGTVFLFTLQSSIGQMETPLAVALLLLAWWAALRAHPLALPALAAAAITRLEWLPLVFVAMGIWWMWTRRWKPIATAMTVLLLAAGWTLQQFHVLLPNSMRAKQIGYSITFARSVQEWVNPRLRDEFLLLLVLLTVLWCAVDAARAWRADRLTPCQMLPVFAMVGALVVAVEYVTRHTVIFPWYRPLVMVPLVLGLGLYVPAFATGGLLFVLMGTLRLVLCAVLLAPWIAPSIPVVRATIHPTIATESRVDGGDSARVQTYLQVGDVLREQCASARVMAPEIGALGWAFGGYMYDGFGIASPGAMRYQPLTGNAPRGGLSAGFVNEVQPDVFIGYTVLDEEPRHNPEVLRNFRLLALPTSARVVRGGALDRGWRSSPHLNVWVKHGGVCDADALSEALQRRF